ncbi:MAG: type II toxin-antitoxin system HicA family toxin [Leptospirales bacterium]
MSKQEKLLKRFLSKPNDFKYTELATMLSKMGYNEIKKGKSSGSRVAFVNEKTKHMIRLHKPHPKNILKLYQIELIIQEFKKMELL